MDLTKVSKKLSYLLRHSTDPLYIMLDGGWADVRVIINALKSSYKDTTMEILEQIVSEDKKGRYSFNEDHTMIRANQGHSISGVRIIMEQPEPPEFLYHGTATRFVEKIMEEGIKPMQRQYVHLSGDLETAIETGNRHGKPAIILIRAKEFVDDGYVLFRSSNGVWLTSEVPCKYISIMKF